MANHLIIGLGGTGGGVIRELRKRIFEEFHSNETPNGINIDYIYVDSSDDDLNSLAGWKVMGTSVHLLEAQKVSIHGINANMFNNLSMYPGINSFLNKEDVSLMTSKLGPLITKGIGGQRRRLGRVLMANNLSVTDSNENFISKLKKRIKDLQQTEPKQQQVTFHICAGLAGGTGSGSIIDVISQIRKNFPPQPSEDPYKIFLYLYVPEMNVVSTDHDEGFYQANGYAALLELNAMSIGKYHPYDATGQKDNYSGEVQRLLNGVNPFEGAYLYSNVNEAGKIQDISNELPLSVADFIFYKIVTCQISGDTSKLGRIEGCENDGAGPECDKSGTPTRSRKFLAFGIKRIEYPEIEIKEYVSYNFARQAARQLEFNKWQDLGFAECSMDEIGIGYASEIKDINNRERLLLSNSYITLQKSIIETSATKRWKDINGTWEQRTQGFADDAQTSAEKKSWFALFTNNCEEYYNQNFRGLGVVKFYSTQRDELSGYSKHIRHHIEHILFDDWNSGQKSILEVEKYTKLLIADCIDRIEIFKEKIAEQESEIGSINETIHKINLDWNNIHWLRDTITNASKKTFSSFKTAKCEYYTVNTRIIAYKYAIELLQKVIEELGFMNDGITAFKGMLNEILEEVEKQADSRCKDTSTDETQTTIKLYDRDKVQNFTKDCIKNEEIQKSNALSIRNHLTSVLGEDGEHSFANLFEKTGYNDAIKIILDDCQTSAEIAMLNAAKKTPLNKMIGVNILEKLKQDYNTKGKRNDFAKDCVNQVKVYLQFNSEEQGKVFDSNSGGKKEIIQVSLPRFDEDKSGFRDDLIDSFKNQGIDSKDDISINYKSNQIVLIAAASGFPLRYLTNVKVLKKKYEDKLAEPNPELNEMVLHTETFPKPLPSLFEVEVSEIKEKLRKPVILAFAMDIITMQEDPQTGEHFYAINILDEFGDYEPHKAGKTLISTIDILAEDYAMSKQLIELVEKKLITEYRSNIKKKEMQDSVKKVLKEKILASQECENNQFNPIYTKYKNICRDIFSNELKEL